MRAIGVMALSGMVALLVAYGAPVALEGVKTDAALAVVRSAGKRTLGFLLMGGTFLEVDDVPLVTASGACSVSADLGSGEVAVDIPAGGKVRVTGFPVRRVSKYNGEKAGAELDYRELNQPVLGAEIERAAE